MATIIRQASKQDIDPIMVLFAQIADYHTEIQPEVYCDADMDAFRKCVLEQMDADDWVLWVAENESRLVGYASVQLRRNRRQYGKVADASARIDCFVVDENCRHCGIGSRLLSEMQAALKADGFTEMTLTVSNCNPAAIACYEKAGFGTYIYQMRKDLK